MILATDIYYYENKAKAVCIAFDRWEDTGYKELYIKELEGIKEYVPGEFYQRELPCILAVLADIPLDKVECIVIDGYVILDNAGKIGLGGHLYNALEGRLPVIGVAKTNFHSNTENVREVLRGDSKNPLFVTTMGIDVAIAAGYIQKMAGAYRFPTLLKELDRITKEIG